MQNKTLESLLAQQWVSGSVPTTVVFNSRSFSFPHNSSVFCPCSPHRRQNSQTQTIKTSTKESSSGEFLLSVHNLVFKHCFWPRLCIQHVWRRALYDQSMCKAFSHTQSRCYEKRPTRSLRCKRWMWEFPIKSVMMWFFDYICFKVLLNPELLVGGSCSEHVNIYPTQKSYALSKSTPSLVL